jgi:hypothetical protein
VLVPPPRLDQGEETGISGELAVADDTQTSAFRRHFAARRADEAAATTTLLEVCGIAKEYGGLVVLGALWSRGEPHLPGRAPHPRTDGARQRRSRLPRSQRSSLLRGIFISRLAQARAEAMEALEYLGLGELAQREVGRSRSRPSAWSSSLGPWPRARRCCCSTSPPRDCPRSSASGCARCCARSARSRACCSSSTTSISSLRGSVINAGRRLALVLWNAMFDPRKVLDLRRVLVLGSEGGEPATCGSVYRGDHRDGETAGAVRPGTLWR